ncbi:hypothetical protein [Methylobacterium radiodurans]|uniref:Uncharacterized protein n=1 Tax=Methylobacterium radiodurans TaxID=2202828 RepID=A0A2U8VXR0_9HYPH|nr:hypothetical protein [Methylobacterium radiodurans]AWN38565.1 hypothetical protein DK427_24850 [Methylobacterium radiodurans]
MHAQAVDDRASEGERIAAAYASAAEGDTWAALVQAVSDALTDLAEAERRSLRRERLISHGYVRGALAAEERA